MKEHNLISAGLIPYQQNENRIIFLLIKNAKTRLWEFPKGLVNANESKLQAAIRESIEETGIDFTAELANISSPINYYYIIEDTIKHVSLFPIETNLDSKKILLSKEHSRFKIACFEEARLLINRPDLVKVLFELRSRIVFAIGSKENKHNFKSKIIYNLSHIIKDSSSLRQNNWFISGSIAHNEHTINSAGTEFSDIDIVKLTNETPTEKEIFKDYSYIKRNLESRGISTSVGIYHLPNYRTVNLNDPFWSAFHNKNILITENTKINSKINYSTLLSNDITYDIFRTTWYKLVRGKLIPENLSQYHFIKAIGFINYIITSCRKSPFINYENQRERVINALATSNTFESQNLLALECYDIKLSRMPVNMQQDWEKAYLSTVKDYIKDSNHENTAIVFTKFLIDFYENSNYIETTRMYTLINSYMGSENAKLFGVLISNKDNFYLIITFLIFLRVEIWPAEVRFSKFKYLSQVKQFIAIHAEQYGYCNSCSQILKLQFKYFSKIDAMNSQTMSLADVALCKSQSLY